MGENTCRSCSDMESISKIYKELIRFNHQTNNNNNNNSSLKMGKGPEETFFQRRYMKGHQVHEEMLIGREMKIKPQWGITSGLLEQLLSRELVRKTRDNNCWWRKEKPCAQLVGLYIGTVTTENRENSIKVAQKIKNRANIFTWLHAIIWSSNFTPGYISKGNKITLSKKYLHSHIH